METRANHVLIGAFTLIVTVAALLFSLWAAKWASDRAWDEYDIVFKEAVTGLSVGGIVQYNGINVGEVSELTLDPVDPRRVIAHVRLRAGTPVKTDTKAKLAFVGLTGVALIQLSGGRPTSPALEPVGGAKHPRIIAETSAFQKLLESSEDIATTASNVLLRINAMLSEENVQRISDTLANIESVTGSVNAEREEIAALIRNARVASERLERTLATTEGVMTRIDQDLASQLPQLVSKLDAALTQIESLTRNADAMMVDNRDAVASFGNQGLTQVGPALTELRSLLRELNRVTARIEDNPAAFVLGRGKPEEFEP
jgi:phospholipid/cholesterol/gamma-HCH transport system substrate-binding protein